MTLISIVIPAYEAAKVLEPTLLRLRQIRAREYPAIEIIVSVRPSIDDTLIVAKRLADRVVTTEGLVSQSRNDGAAMAQGDVIIFLDADAVPSFGTLPCIAANVSKDTVGTCTYIPRPLVLRTRLVAFFQNSMRALHLCKGSGLIFCHRTLFFQKGVRYDPRINIGEHHDFLRRAKKHGKARYRYLSIPKGFELDVSHYERTGYLKLLWFWTCFSLYLAFDGKDKERWAERYWTTHERTSPVSEPRGRRRRALARIHPVRT